MFEYFTKYSKIFYNLYFIKSNLKNKSYYEDLLDNILKCGCIPIKFIQWLIPFLYQFEFRV